MYTLSYTLTPAAFKSLLVFLSLENSLLNLKLNYNHPILSLSNIENLTEDDLPNATGMLDSGSTLCSFKYDVSKHRLEVIITKKKFDTPYSIIGQGLREIIESL